MSIKHYCDVCQSELNTNNPNQGKGYVLEHTFDEEREVLDEEGNPEVDEDGDPITETVPTVLVQAKIHFGVQTNKDQRLMFGDGDLCAQCANEVLQHGLIKE